MKYLLCIAALLVTSCVGPITHTTYTPGIDQYGAYVDVDNPNVPGVTRLYKGPNGYFIMHNGDSKLRTLKEIIGEN